MSSDTLGLLEITVFIPFLYVLFLIIFWKYSTDD